MKKVLLAVDSTLDSREMLSLFHRAVQSPGHVLLLHVEQLEGNALMTGMLGDAEISTLKESLQGTEHKEALDRRADRILSHYEKELSGYGLPNIRTLVRDGNPSEEILKVAREENVDLIMVGCSGKSRIQKFFTGCTSREIEKNAKVPVLIAKGRGCGVHAAQWGGREAYSVR